MTEQLVVRIDALIEAIRVAARIPGIGFALVHNGELCHSAGYGHSDLGSEKPVTPATSYAAASTTKALNATLIAMLVEEGALDWDAPVERYLPSFRLSDPARSREVTLRDLVMMRTGLPRHDFAWHNNPFSRAQLVERLGHLPLSAGFRAQFQYNNMTVTTAGHVAELVTGIPWEDQIGRRILDPLGMRNTGFTMPVDSATPGYSETATREIRPGWVMAGDATAPSGGAMWTTVLDMARWAICNLEEGRPLALSAAAHAELQRPQIFLPPGLQPELSSDAAYGLGWYIDRYRQHRRVEHSGYHQDINSDLMLFPELGIGLICFTNFGFPLLARFINQCAFDLVVGEASSTSIADRLADYSFHDLNILLVHVLYSLQ